MADVMTHLLAWPPVFSLVKNPRSKSVRLKLCARKGIQLVVPRHFPLNKALSFLEQHRAWLEKTWATVYGQQPLQTSIETLTQLNLLALEEVWSIDYKMQAIKHQVLTVGDTKSLMVKGAEPVLIKQALQQWLQAYAAEKLLPWLAELSKRSNLPYQQAKIRIAHTRWGSCSSQKSIMLNAKLLFLPKAWVEYVMLHELCHTVHMNHSPHFWQLLEQCYPQAYKMRQQLKAANPYLPMVLWS